jgi:hypothetical protein
VSQPPPTTTLFPVTQFKDEGSTAAIRSNYTKTL